MQPAIDAFDLRSVAPQRKPARSQMTLPVHTDLDAQTFQVLKTWKVLNDYSFASALPSRWIAD
ncbi:MAG: hypothetical protein HY868_26845 [Chloroflexi bacterium]|nr:hypothetical protein [Chloroflexota bacterium]